MKIEVTANLLIGKNKTNNVIYMYSKISTQTTQSYWLKICLFHTNLPAP